MGIFDRFLDFVGDVVDTVADVAERLVGGAADTVEEAAAEVADVVEEAAAEVADVVEDVADAADAALERESFADELGPVIDEHPDDVADLDALTLEQYYTLFEDYEAAGELEEGFTDKLRDAIERGDWDLADELITSIDMDAPDGDTGEAAA